MAADRVGLRSSEPEVWPRTSLRELALRDLPDPGTLNVVGVRGSGASVLSVELHRRTGRPVLHVVAEPSEVSRVVDDLRAFHAGLWGPALTVEPSHLDVSDGTPFDNAKPDRQRELQRIAARVGLSGGQHRVVVVPARALLRKHVPEHHLTRRTCTIERGQHLDFELTVSELAAHGYRRVALVEEVGEFAVRGGLFDLWPPGAKLPLRVELDGDSITRLREFSPRSQVAERELESKVLPPAREIDQSEAVLERALRLAQSLCDSFSYPTTKTRGLLDEIKRGQLFFGSDALLPAYHDLEGLLDDLDSSVVVLIEDPVRVVRALQAAAEEALTTESAVSDRPHFPYESLYETEASLMAQLSKKSVVLAHPIGVLPGAGASGFEALEAAPSGTVNLGATAHTELLRALREARKERGKHGVLDPLVEHLERWQAEGSRVVLTARSAFHAERLATLLSHRGLATSLVDAGGPEHARGSQVSIVTSPLARGAVFENDGLVLLTEEEVFGTRRHRESRPKKKQNTFVLDDLRALAPGDYVVHVEHGVGCYRGLENKQVGQSTLDLVLVEYAGGDKLFLPVYRLNQLQKHAATDSVVKLDRLGGQTFQRTKARVRKKVRQLADQLLKLYAERAEVQRPPIPAPDDDYEAFSAAFPFEETRDQMDAILDTIGDLARPVVMDRLVSGDVGFGKTEVALRAAFLNVMQSRQVAFLCPTTVLAQQHFLTCQARFSDLPVEVRVLSRFQSKKAQTETLALLRQGRVDLVVGTHRLLSKDVHFKNLGLLVVDEEQRFGVSHKERIKQMKTTVDVLTLSATPIPRTLQMAVSGVRDLSIINTAPSDRRSVRTIVSRVDDSLVRAAIERELARAGQVFFVYNRVEGLEERAQRLRELVPGLSVVVAHGQQSERALEKAMLGFVEGKYDVLCSTAIVESGLDIPRANTMIIDRADILGLSQLYQLRGRVGRSSQQAYCYLMVPAPSRMTDVARARIEAMERHSELGSGIQIATMDMELRGAGDLLGAEQSGFLQSVGFELFSEMLRDAASELRGESVVHPVDPELSVDVEAYLPAEYVDDLGVRLSLYKRLSAALDRETVANLADEMVNRFGTPPEPARRLVQLMTLKVDLRELRAEGCEATRERVTLHLRQDTPLPTSAVMTLVTREPERYRVSPTGSITRIASPKEKFARGLDHALRAVSELGKLSQDGAS